MKALEIKVFSPTRYSNMRSCDQKYYSFSADWSQPQKRSVIADAMKKLTARLDVIEAALAGDGWGSKPDTAELVAGIRSLLKTPLTSDDQQNSFIAYQLERYTLRAWYRGTKEQRDAAKAKLEPKPAPAPKAAKPKVAVKAKTSTKKAAPKSAPTTNDGKVVVHEVEVDDPVSAQLITYLGTFLQDELSADQKRSFVTGLCAMLKN